MKKSTGKCISPLLLIGLAIFFNGAGVKSQIISNENSVTGKIDSGQRQQALILWKNKIEWQQKREPDNYRKFVAGFIDIFNSDDISKILDRVSNSFLTDTTPEKVLAFLKFFKKDQGNIKSARFKYFDKRKQRRDAVDLAVYFLEFENGTQWEFRVGLDDNVFMTR